MTVLLLCYVVSLFGVLSVVDSSVVFVLHLKLVFLDGISQFPECLVHQSVVMRHALQPKRFFVKCIPIKTVYSVLAFIVLKTKSVLHRGNSGAMWQLVCYLFTVFNAIKASRNHKSYSSTVLQDMHQQQLCQCVVGLCGIAVPSSTLGSFQILFQQVWAQKHFHLVFMFVLKFHDCFRWRWMRQRQNFMKFWLMPA